MAGTKDLVIDKGATYKLSLIWSTKDQFNVKTPVDLTGYTAASQIRESYDAVSPIVSLTTGSGIVLGGVTGTIDLVITAAVTTAITIDKGVWDLELTNPSGEVIRLLSGKVTFKPEVTK